MLQHKGYTGVAEVDFEAGAIAGRVVGLRDVVTFDGRTAQEAAASFRAAVDAYLEMCREAGQEPEKPYSGKFVVRIAPDVHRELARIAAESGVSLNDVAAEGLAARVGMVPGRARRGPTTWEEAKADLEAARVVGRGSKGKASRPAGDAPGSRKKVAKR
jgi:predicted HicB family RNase H-like nuclease